VCFVGKKEKIMNDATKHPDKQSPLQFQMWDRYLTELNTLWDLEQLSGLPAGQERPTPLATHFHTTLWDQHLLTLNQSWHVAPTFAVAPPTSVFGKLLLPLKKLVLRWVQPVIEALVQQQNAVNAQFVQTCNGVVETVNNDAIRLIEAQKEFNARVVRTLNGFVETVDRELRRELQELQMMIWTFDRRKEALEIDEILLNQKLEQVLGLLRDSRQSVTGKSSYPLPVRERQDDYTYVLFENLYRGDETTIKTRQTEYMSYFQNGTNVLDIGCGRGEFLELLHEHNITGYGVDANQTMVQYCRNKGLKAEEADVFAHLQSLPDDSLDGIFTAQTIEHCPPPEVHRLLQLCFVKLQPHKYCVIETQNPTSLYALSHFYRDLSHENPIHPDALAYLLKTVGFQDTQIEYKAPFAKDQMLQELKFDALEGVNDSLRANLEILNTNIQQLNGMLYGYLDYAVIARKIRFI
jgi:2-polyprenyl-3-methyl-5-hydroxy-6-metoxy-1,4-benzoquinol methylase